MRSKKVLTATSLLLIACIVGGLFAFFAPTPQAVTIAQAAGGSCEDAPIKSVEGSANHVSLDAPDGYIIVGVCIKSGNNMFGGEKHSGVLGNGTYENGCYTVSGVGTSSASIDRNFDSETCQGISHGDAYYVSLPPTGTPITPSATYTLTFTPTETVTLPVVTATVTSTVTLPVVTDTNTPTIVYSPTIVDTPTGTEVIYTPTLMDTPTGTVVVYTETPLPTETGTTVAYTPTPMDTATATNAVITDTPVVVYTPTLQETPGDPCGENPEQCVTVTLTVQNAPPVAVQLFIPVCQGCSPNGTIWETPSGSPGWQNNELEGAGPLGVEVAVVTDNCYVDHGRCNYEKWLHVLFDTSIGDVTLMDNGVDWDIYALGRTIVAPNGRTYIYYVGPVCDSYLDKDRSVCHSGDDQMVYINGELQKSYAHGGLMYDFWPCSLAPNQGMVYQNESGQWVIDWVPGFTTHDLVIFAMKMGWFEWPETWPDNPKPGNWNWDESPLKEANEWAIQCQAKGPFEPCLVPNQ